MLPDRVSNPGPLTYESGALPIALRGPAMVLGWCWVILIPERVISRARIYCAYIRPGLFA